MIWIKDWKDAGVKLHLTKKAMHAWDSSEFTIGSIAQFDCLM